MVACDAFEIVAIRACSAFSTAAGTSAALLLGAVAKHAAASTHAGTKREFRIPFIS
jgi:hypothetical protein